MGRSGGWSTKCADELKSIAAAKQNTLTGKQKKDARLLAEAQSIVGTKGLSAYGRGNKR
jgi:hypothetical protein